MYSKSYDKIYRKINSSRDSLKIEEVKNKYYKPIYHRRNYSDNLI